MADVTITQGTVSHALSATTPDNPTAEIQPQHWNSAHAASLVLAASVASALFSNANGMSFGLSESAITGSYTVPTQSVQTQPAGNIVGAGFTSTTTAGAEVKATQNSAGLSMAVPAYLTTAMASNRGTDFVQAAAAFAGTNASGTIASNGISVSVAAPGGGDAIRGIAAGGSTASTNTVNFSNLNGISFGFGAGGNSTVITGSHNALTTARASNDAVGLNTALTANGVSWTVNSSGISLNVPAYLTTAALSNHSHGNPTLALTNLSGTTASNSAGLTLSLSAAAPGGGADKTISFVEIADGGRFTTCAAWNNATFSRRPIIVPFQCEHALQSCNTIRIFASRTGGTVLQATFFAGVYTRANATSMNLVSSTSFAASLTTSAQFSGIRIYDFTGLGALSLSPGGYVLGLLASAAATNSVGLNIMGGDNMPLAGFVVGGTTTAATHSQSNILPFWGVFNATSAGLPSAVAMSSISAGNGVNSPDIYGVIRAV